MCCLKTTEAMKSINELICNEAFQIKKVAAMDGAFQAIVKHKRTFQTYEVKVFHLHCLMCPQHNAHLKEN